MTKNIYLFYCILIMSALFGCNKKSDTCSYTPDPNLNSSELKWVSCYANHQVVWFKNELGDSTSASADYSIYTHGPLANRSAPEPCDVGYQTAWNILKFSNIELQIFLTVEHYYPPYPENLNSAGASFDGNFTTYKFYNCTIQNGVVVNSKTYNGVYIIQIDTTKGAKPTTPAVWQAYYTQANGIIQFKTGGGHTWVQQ